VFFLKGLKLELSDHAKVSLVFGGGNGLMSRGRLNQDTRVEVA
jgi:hypothetical protein